MLGDYLPTKLAMDQEERVVWACIPGDYRRQLLFFFDNGKAARVELSAYQTQTRRKKLTGAYSDKAPWSPPSCWRRTRRWRSTPPRGAA